MTWLPVPECDPQVVREELKAIVSRYAIEDRCRGLFELANYFEETLHQLENQQLMWSGRFPGLEGVAYEEFRRQAIRIIDSQGNH